MLHSWRLAARPCGITLGMVLLAAILIPLPLGAQQPVGLEQVVEDELIEYVIIGKSLAFAEPMLSLELQNVSQDSLNVEILAGLELNSENPDHADVIVGKDSLTLLQPKEEQKVDLYAFSLDPTRSFPPPDAHYTVRQMNADQEILAVLADIGEQGAEEKLSAQLAVWMQTTGYDFEQLEDTLGVPLGRYYTETLSFLDGAIPKELLEPTETKGAPRSEISEPSPTLSTASTSMPEPSSMLLAAILIAGGVVIIVLIALPVHVGRKNRKQPEEKADRLASPSASVLATAEPTCIVCKKPLSQCTCAGRVQREPMEQPLRLEMKDNRAREKTLNIRPGTRLVALEGQCIGSQYNLPQSDILLTRTGLPFVTIPLPVISSPHALIFLDEQPFRIKDLNSTNGIRVNGQKLLASPEALLQDRTASLRDGAQVTFGNASFAFEENPPLLRDDQGQVYRLPPGTRVLVTRYELPYLEVKDGTVSVPHALVGWESEQHVVRDLNSGNGTEVGLRADEGFDYRRIDLPLLLMVGMRLRLGNAVLEVRPGSGATVPGAGDKRIGPYLIVRAIGQGGMARLYEGRDPEGERVAIKVPRDIYAYDAGFRSRFEREARSMQRLDHHGIVRILDVGEDKALENLVDDMGLQYIAMGYVDGCSLDRLLVSERPLGEAVVVELVRSVAEALRHAHAQGVIHRDIKPNNILISRKGKVLITDFGIARATGEMIITQPGERRGSPHYISPEQAAGRNEEVDARSDIYSLGTVLYQMITGRVPFDGNTPVPKVLVKHCTEPPLPPDQIRARVPAHLAAMAMKCLEKKPDARYQAVQEMIGDLPPHPSAANELARLVADALQERKATDTNAV